MSDERRIRVIPEAHDEPDLEALIEALLLLLELGSEVPRVPAAPEDTP